LNPFTTYLGAGSTLEQLGQQPLDIGAQLGGRAATAGANVGQALLTGGTNAALTQQRANEYNPFATALSGLANNQRFQQGVENYFNPPKALNYSMGTPTSSGGLGLRAPSGFDVGYNPQF